LMMLRCHDDVETRIEWNEKWLYTIAISWRS
jgi:hypothetical protein